MKLFAQLGNLISVSITLCFFLLMGCFGGGKVAPSNSTLKIAATAGPQIAVLEFVKAQAKKVGLEIRIIEFNDYILPNIALAQGDVDLNCYQHLPFLENQIKIHGYPITSVGKTLLLPMGLYAKRIGSLAEIPEKATIAIPNDPTNGGRALLILEDIGLLKLRAGSGLTATVQDIVSNPKKLKIVELEAPQIPRTLDDVDLAIINTDWAILAGLSPTKDTLALESKDSPYVNVIAARLNNKDDPKVLEFVKLYQSPATAHFVEKNFGSAVIAAW